MSQQTATEVDLETIRSQLGKSRESTEWFTVTQQIINRFADATFDHQFIHIDPEKARSTPFGSTIAHGFLTLSLLPLLLAPIQLVPANIIMGINYGLNRVRFPSVVKVNSRIRASTILKEVSFPAPDRLLLTSEVTVHVEGQDKPAMVAESLAMWVLAKEPAA
ncbi:MAG: MaoC family dehydratase [Xanthomonadales bacterium]|nr:MaoC family dehydratase [Xanthomonadales bacterium]